MSGNIEDKCEFAVMDEEKTYICSSPECNCYLKGGKPLYLCGSYGLKPEVYKNLLERVRIRECIGAGIPIPNLEANTPCSSSLEQTSQENQESHLGYNLLSASRHNLLH